MMALSSKKLDVNKQNTIFLFFFLLANIMIFWKCSRAIANIDETFYLTVPYRLLQGDALFLHEWHLSQMSSVIIYPMVAFYNKLNGNLDGIVLFSRYVYAAVNCLYGAFIYLRIKKSSWVCAICVSLMCTLYVPFNIPALSYNSVGIMSLLSALIIIYTAESTLGLQYTIAGIFVALAVLCNPYLTILYVIFAIFAFTVSHKNSEASRLKQLFFITLGCLIVAIPFLAFVLSRASLDSLIDVLPLILNDPDHQKASFLYKVKSYFGAITMQRGYFLPLYGLIAIIFFTCFFDKKRFYRNGLYFCVAAGFTAVLMLAHSTLGIINALMWSVNVMGPFIFLLTDNGQIKSLFYHFWLPGILYSFCMHMASNQRFVSIASGATVAAVGTLMMLIVYASQSRNFSRTRFRCLLSVITAALILFQLSSTAYLRYKQTFLGEDVEYQTVMIDGGVFDGLFVSDKVAEAYLLEKEVLSYLDNYNVEKVLYLDVITWYYLANNYNFSSYSSWLGYADASASIERLKMYYSLYPEKMPDAVLANSDRAKITNLFCETFNYRAEVYENGVVLLPKA